MKGKFNFHATYEEKVAQKKAMDSTLVPAGLNWTEEQYLAKLETLRARGWSEAEIQHYFDRLTAVDDTL